MDESSILEEMACLPGAVLRDEHFRVADRQGDGIPASGKSCFLNRYDSVVGTGQSSDYTAKAEAAIPGEHTNFHIGRYVPAGLPGGITNRAADKRRQKWNAQQYRGAVGASARRSHQDNPSDAGDRCASQHVQYDQTAKAVGDQVERTIGQI